MDTEELNNLNEALNEIRQSETRFDYTIDLDDNRIKGYKGYASIANDLKTVGEYISLLLDINNIELDSSTEMRKINQLTQRSLFVSSIITYARCFTQTHGRGIKLESKDCFNNDQEDFKHLHSELMEIRNQYLAHAGVSNSEKIFASANFNIDKDEVSLRLSYEIVGQFGISNTKLLRFLDIVKHLLEKAVMKRNEASKKYKDNLTDDEKKSLLKKAYDKKNAR